MLWVRLQHLTQPDEVVIRNLHLITPKTTTLGGAGSTDATIGRTSSQGSGNTHTHGTSGLSASSSFSGVAVDLAVQYVDFIIAQKD